MNQYGSSYRVNAISVLGSAKLTVTTGYRERYTVTIAPDDFPGYPALMINLGKSQDRAAVGARKSSPAPAPASEPSVTPFKASKKQIERAAEHIAPLSEPETPEEI